jgi:hypothetical protein
MGIGVARRVKVSGYTEARRIMEGRVDEALRAIARANDMSYNELMELISRRTLVETGDETGRTYFILELYLVNGEYCETVLGYLEPDDTTLAVLYNEEIAREAECWF